MSSQDDKQKRTKVVKQVSPKSFLRALPTPPSSDKSGEQIKYTPVPKQASKQLRQLDKPWRIILSSVENPSQQMGLEIQGDVILGVSSVPDEEIHVNFAQWQGEERSVSHRHARLRPSSKALFIMDLGSTNSTHINGTLLTTDRVQPLQDGDLVTLGRLHLRVRIVAHP